MPEPMSNERLAEIRDRLAVLPEGPWYVEDCEGDLRIWREGALHGVTRDAFGEITGYRLPVSIGPENLIAEWVLDTWDDGEDDADDLRRDIARFFGAAREDVPALLAEVERLRTELRFAFPPRTYMDIQQVLDAALGTEEMDGAGAGIIADVALVAGRMRTAEAEVKRLNGVVQLLGSQLQGGAQDFVDALAEIERRIPIEDVERFLKRERDEYEPRGECWSTVDDVLDVFRLHMVTGTPLTEPRPHEGPEALGNSREPLTEAEELRAEVERLSFELSRVQEEANRRIQQLDQRFDQALTRAQEAEEQRRVAERKLNEIAMVKVWTNEDGKKFVFVDDMAAVMLPPLLDDPEHSDGTEGADA
jgi:hypothetical protein